MSKSDNKKSLVITLYAIIHLIFGIALSILFYQAHQEEGSAIPPLMPFIIIFFCFLIAGGLFKRNFQIYRVFLIYAVYRVGIAIILSFNYVFTISFPLVSFILDVSLALFYSFALFYFSRPEIRDQFK